MRAWWPLFRFALWLAVAPLAVRGVLGASLPPAVWTCSAFAFMVITVANFRLAWLWLRSRGPGAR